MNRIEARVAAVNAAGIMANDIQPKLVKVMRQFIGKKVVTQQGELIAQAKKAIAEVLGDGRGVHLDSYKTYRLCWVVKTCVSSDSQDGSYQHANYHECYITVGSIENYVLVSVNDEFVPYATDYTVKEIVDARKAYEDAKNIADDLRSKLHPFGEYDR